MSRVYLLVGHALSWDDFDEIWLYEWLLYSDDPII
jgi:hypothetical protein